MYSSRMKTNSSNEAATLPPSGERSDSEQYTDDKMLEMAQNMMAAFMGMEDKNV